MIKRITSFIMIILLFLLFPTLTSLAHYEIKMESMTISTGHSHSAAIQADGSLWTWGFNVNGQLGDGTRNNSEIPIKVMENVIAVSASNSSHTMAIQADGSLWAWGLNFNGQLGDGTLTNRHAPVKVMEDVIAVSQDFTHTMAIKADGSLWAWGLNDEGQLGDGTTQNRRTPVRILDNVASVSTSRGHTMAIKTNGTLWAWGDNIFGQLGVGTITNHNTPVRVMNDVTYVSVGRNHTMAVTTDGSLWAWGFNGSGQLGDGTTHSKLSPIRVMDNVTAVSANRGYTMAITTDGSLWAWGSNRYGRLGDGTFRNHLTPMKIMDDVIAVCAGERHALATTTNGSLWAWGRNLIGELGDGTTDNRNTPVEIMGNIMFPPATVIPIQSLENYVEVTAETVELSPKPLISYQEFLILIAIIAVVILIVLVIVVSVIVIDNKKTKAYYAVNYPPSQPTQSQYLYTQQHIAYPQYNQHQPYQPYQPQVKKSGIRGKIILSTIIAAATVIIVVAVVFLISMLMPRSNYELRERSLRSNYELRERSLVADFLPGEGVLVLSNDGEVFELEGPAFDVRGSLDNTVTAMLIRTQDMSKKLYLITDEFYVINENVYGFAVSADGNTVAYLTHLDERYRLAELWTYSDGEHTKIAYNICISTDIAISPDGSAVAFVGFDENVYIGFVYDGEIHELGIRVIPIAVSNGADFIYYVFDDVLYVQSGVNSDRGERLGDDIRRIFFNRDFSQIVYVSGMSTYISNRGESRISLAGEIYRFITPQNTAITFIQGNAFILGVLNFAETFYIGTNNIVFFIDNRFETHTIANDVEMAYLSYDGRTLTFLEHGSIKRMERAGPNARYDAIVNEDVIWFKATRDGRGVFFANYAMELFFQRDDERPVFVSNAIDLNTCRYGGSAWGLFSDNTLFFVNEGELFSSDGDGSRHIRGLYGEVVTVFASESMIFGALFYGENNERFSFYSFDGENFYMLR